MFAIGLLAALIGLAAAIKTVREKPADCMRPVPPRENFPLGRAAHTAKPARIPLKMALRNIAVKPARGVMTAVGIAGCVALLVCGFGIGDTVQNSIDHELGVQFTYDVAGPVAMEARDAFTETAAGLKADGKIEACEIYKTFFMSAKTDGGRAKDIRVYALPDGAELTTIRPENKTIMSRAVAQDLGLKAGDSVTLTAAGNLYRVTVDELVDSSFTKGIFVRDDGRFDAGFYTLNAWIKTDNADAALLDALNAVNGAGGMQTMQSVREHVDSVVSSIDAIQLTLTVFAVLLSVTVLYNLSLLAIKERSRDIATLKVLGFTPGQIGLSLLYEILILAAVGTAVGLLLGYPVTLLVMGINKIEALTFLYCVSPLSFVYSAAISLVTALFINLLFRRPIRKIHMVESLKSVE
jgi:putative ABC transport system permease protein